MFLECAIIMMRSIQVEVMGNFTIMLWQNWELLQRIWIRENRGVLCVRHLVHMDGTKD